MKIVIVDYNMGNLRSVFNKFRRINLDTIITSNYSVIENADKLVLPGVGHFKYGMENLRKMNLIDSLTRKVIHKKIPILGICLGAQLFAKTSEEGNCEGLSWIDAEVVKFRVSDKIRFKVPHIGWNNTQIINHNPIDPVIQPDDQFYFIHSYHLKCNNERDVWMNSTYDYEFVSAVRSDNIYGTQFHPEKSQDVGYELIKKFVEL